MNMISALAFSVFLSAFPGGAAGGGPGGGGAGNETDSLNAAKLMMILKTVDLSPDQWKQVHQIMRADRPQIVALRKQVQALREQIADKLTGTGSLQASDIAPLRQQIRTLQEQIDDQAVQIVFQIRGLMSQQQLAQLAASHAKFKQLRQEYEALVKGDAD
jgi:Spy/CpxP family protein refolding chaperone